jgi:hypothetical protein
MGLCDRTLVERSGLDAFEDLAYCLTEVATEITTPLDFTLLFRPTTLPGAKYGKIAGVDVFFGVEFSEPWTSGARSLVA